MPRVVNDVLQKVKVSCDKDTFLFHFAGGAKAEAYTRNILYKMWGSGPEADADENDCYFYKIIMPRMASESVYNVYYKNTNNVWIDYRRCKASHPNVSITSSSIQYENIFKINNEAVPSCIFTDDEYYIHYIDEHDGVENNKEVPLIDIDASKNGVVTYRPISIDNPGLPLTGKNNARHIMEDLFVKTDGFPSKTIFTWLNGVFVPIIPDETYEDAFYIKNAMSMIGSRCVNQKLNSPIEYKGGGTATVIVDESFNEYRLDVRLRLFSWKNIIVSPWYSPILSEKTPIVHNFTSVFITNKITFPTPVNRNAHMILENGVILDPSEYIIDGSDPRKIELKDVTHNAYILLKELIKDFNNPENIQFYAGIKPLSLLEIMLTHKSYSLVNFSSSEEAGGKKLYLKRSQSCIADFPYKNEITFTNVNLGDLITVNGTFNEYEWIHEKTIYIPRFINTYRGSEAKIREKDVTRYYFICK